MPSFGRHLLALVSCCGLAVAQSPWSAQACEDLLRDARYEEALESAPMRHSGPLCELWLMSYARTRARFALGRYSVAFEDARSALLMEIDQKQRRDWRELVKPAHERWRRPRRWPLRLPRNLRWTQLDYVGLLDGTRNELAGAALCLLAELGTRLDDFAGAEGAWRAAAAYWARLGRIDDQCHALMRLSYVLLESRRYEALIAAADHATRAARRIRDRACEVELCWLIAHASRSSGNFDRALEEARRGLSLARERGGLRGFNTRFRLEVAHALIGRKDFVAAHPELVRVLFDSRAKRHLLEDAFRALRLCETALGLPRAALLPDGPPPPHEGTGAFADRALRSRDALQQSKIKQGSSEWLLWALIVVALALIVAGCVMLVRFQRWLTRQAQRDAMFERQHEWISSIVHDLRGPLTSILGRSFVLRKTSPDAVALAQGFESDAALLEERIKSILDASIPLVLDDEVVDLSIIANRSASLFRSRLGEKSLRLQLTCDPRVRVQGSGRLLGRVFENLIANAIAFAPVDSSVRITLHEADNGVELQVIDDGAGVPDELVDRIFEPYFSRRPDGESGGSGLGLALVREVVELHGGTIEYRRIGGRTAFVVWLPHENPAAKGRLKRPRRAAG